MKLNPRHGHLHATLVAKADKLLRPWQGDCWRFQDAEFPTGKDILSGEGARLNGGRLNVRGSFPVVYGSLSEETALKETNARAKRYGLVVRKPRVFVCIHLDLQRVLDLTDATTRRTLDLPLKVLREEDWEKLQDSGVEALGQALGRAAWQAGAEGVMIPSFAHRGGTNVAFFPGNRTEKSKIRIYESEVLPAGKGTKGRK